MSDPGQDLVAEIDRVVQVSIDNAVAGNRSKISEGLFNWLSFTARKKQTTDLPDKLEEMRKRIEALAEDLQLRREQGQTVVKVTGDSANTLRMLERGTDWFDPADNVTDMIVGAVLD